MTALKSQPIAHSLGRLDTPPLQNGDRLTRAEFERRYSAMPSFINAELIEGIVYMASPVRYRKHGKPHSTLNALIVNFVSKTPGLEDYSDNSTVRLDEDNEPQPDIVLLLPAAAGGLATIDDHDYIVGPPDLACEIAASSVSIDLHAKLNVYRRNRVKEYLVWRTEDAAVDWFILRDGTYVPLAAASDGILCSETFPGLWINVPALMRGDLPELFRTLDLGTSTPDHRAFVERLKTSAA